EWSGSILLGNRIDIIDDEVESMASSTGEAHQGSRSAIAHVNLHEIGPLSIAQEDAAYPAGTASLGSDGAEHLLKGTLLSLLESALGVENSIREVHEHHSTGDRIEGDIRGYSRGSCSRDISARFPSAARGSARTGRSRRKTTLMEIDQCLTKLTGDHTHSLSREGLVTETDNLALEGELEET
ncbi:hypothetical protein PMAYCL1PPCAC_11819, partial [Pristionchus mayeri]